MIFALIVVRYNSNNELINVHYRTEMYHELIKCMRKWNSTESTSISDWEWQLRVWN